MPSLRHRQLIYQDSDRKLKKYAGFFTVFFWINYHSHFPAGSVQYVSIESPTHWLTALHPSKVPLCQDNAIHHLEGSRCGIRGAFSTSGPWRTRFRSAPCEWTRRTSEVPPRREWTPPTLQYSHNETLRGFPDGCGERGSSGIHWSELCLICCLCKASLIT